MRQNRKNVAYRIGGFLTLAVLLFGWTVFQPIQTIMAAESNKQKVFKTPKAATEALLEALRKNDNNALLAIFGHQYKDFIVGTDKVAARERRMQAYRAAQEFKTLQRQTEDKVILIIGSLAWPVPVPIVREKSGWRFDTEEGFEEVLNRRVGQNELNAIGTAGAYVAAQVQYASKDRDGDQVLEYAQNIGSSKGKKDGLYWEIAPNSGEESSPFGPFVADAKNYLEGRKPGDPFKGYYFKILTRQGEDSPGGRYDLGLVDAIEAECTRFTEREGIYVKFTADIPIKLPIPKDVSLCLYRLTQEGLRNIAKHSQAQEARIILSTKEGSILLSIQDFGVGFDPAMVRGKQGLGLASMGERVNLIRGSLSVRSTPGKGTLIEVQVPLAGTQSDPLTTPRQVSFEGKTSNFTSRRSLLK